MKRTALVIVIAVTLGAGAAHSIPLPREVRDAPDLTDTTWAGDGAVAFTVYRFEKGGVLSFTYNNRTYRTGHWKQDGAELYFEDNGRYYEFKGRIEGQQITGKSWNVRGRRWELKIKRQAR